MMSALSKHTLFPIVVLASSLGWCRPAGPVPSSSPPRPPRARSSAPGCPTQPCRSRPARWLPANPPKAATPITATAPATSDDNDLGVQSLLRTPEQRKPWTLFANGGFVYTTNVALTQHNQQDDVFFRR